LGRGGPAAALIVRKEVPEVRLKDFRQGLTEEEWRRFYRAFKDPEIARLNGHRPLRLPLWLFRRLVEAELARGDRVAFGILDEAGEWIGAVELYDLKGGRATLGILLSDKSRWGKGYGSQAVRRALDYAFEELGLEAVELRTFRWNARARRAFEKAGFRLVGFAPAPGGEEDALMAITREEWARGAHKMGA